ncbi:NAD(P)/FAD-dependent oxidoreductase [Pseudohalioglobus lutimaris]|uniref:Aminoacetone oxidase family FAD-binding enzyme n=1 Tax=Pseudohalioglobus lutimaris TaxID=1737061 RepID=A0A2N5X842_9GAMM|nr:NAD(P)/FAD-dependent oxidoreductase [Pseudohalioglobus lutimaris]PLW70657.1 aminoacetone oxidase family FAD-binding enzyme [Pseudohalioglobus lutimaris]
MVTQSPQHRFDVIVLGAGASGLMCAAIAARRGLSVLVLEKSNKVGKKILMSGGGRCNFTNHFVDADNFISANPHFCKSALTQYSQWDFISLVERYEIDYEERKHSQLFCVGSAREILDMLLAECAAGGVVIEDHCNVESIGALPPAASSAQNAARYELTLREDGKRRLCCHSLVVATGALSIPTLGGSDYGYEIARQFSIPLTERRAGLVPFMFSDSLKAVCERLSGLALEVDLSCNSHSFVENILFTHRGISGPAALQISNYWYPGGELVINLLPYREAASWLLQEKQEAGRALLRSRLQQVLPKPLVLELQALWWAELADKPLAELSDQRLVQIGELLNCWRVKPSATEGYRTAEVTLGGVSTDALSSKTMEARHQPGLFFVGEVVDVSGHLGGFNFQWAWSSGYVAGMNV